MSKGQRFGSPSSALGRNYTGTGGSSGAQAKRRSPRGFYHTEIVKEYRGLTERDFELKLDYGLDLVSTYLGIPVDMLTIRKKSEKQTMTAIDTVYYIKRGTDIIGKLSIRAQRRFKDRSLIFVYLSKNAQAREFHKLTVQSTSYTNQNRSTKRQGERKRQRKKRRSTL